MDYVVCTVKSLNGSTAEACADDIFDYCGFGRGEDRSGVLLLISTGDRKWHISTRGYGITVFTDAGIQYIGEELKEKMKSADYAGTFLGLRISATGSPIRQKKTDRTILPTFR